MRALTVLLFVVANTFGCALGSGFRDHVAFVPDPVNPWPWQEGAAVEKAKKKSPMQGATVYGYFQNKGDKALVLKDVLVNGKPASELASKSPYGVVWWRLNPHRLQPGQTGELAVRLRVAPSKPLTLTTLFESGEKKVLCVAPREPVFRIQTIAFKQDLKTVYLYVERNAGAMRFGDILLDGKQVKGKVTWLSDKYVGLVRLAKVELDTPLQAGSWHTWSVKAGSVINSATLRTFSETVRFGIYGDQSYERYAAGGLDGVYMFAAQNRQSLDKATEAGMKVVMHITGGKPPRDVFGHPALLGYNICDEPDAKDWAAGRKRPEYLRLGTLAPRMVSEIQTCQQQDPSKPAMLTVDLTFTPGNYYTYGPIADITTPDLYPVTVGWPLKSILVGARHAKRATAPRPFGFTYQGCFEQYAKLPKGKSWIGRDEVLRIGFDKLRDQKRSRGYNRKPHPSEVKMQVGYILGAGARNFWAWWDVTECGGLLFQGLRDLPDQWKAVCDMAKTLSSVRDQIELSHPVEWAKSSMKGVWVATLLCGDSDVLVVAVNENNVTVREGFTAKPVNGVEFILPNLDWLEVGKVRLLKPEGTENLRYKTDESGVRWMLADLNDVAVFWLSR